MEISIFANIWRWAKLLLLILLISAMVGAAFPHPSLVIRVVFISGCLGLFGLGLLVEALFLRISQAGRNCPPGFQATLTKLHPASRVQFRVFPSPFPEVLAVRCIFGGGLVLVSEGLLASTTETELRKILVLASGCCHRRGIALKGIAGILAWFLFDRSEAQFGVFKALNLAITFPLVRFFRSLTDDPGLKVGRISTRAPLSIPSLSRSLQLGASMASLGAVSNISLPF